MPSSGNIGANARDVRQRPFSAACGAIHLAIVFTLFFSFLELMKDARNSQWSGLDGEAWLRIGAGALVYFGAFLMLIPAVSRLLRMVSTRMTRIWRPSAARVAGSGDPATTRDGDPATAGRDLATTTRVPGAVLAGGAVWAILSMFREHTPTLDDALVLGGLLGLGMALWLLPKWWGRTWAACGWAVLTLAAGIVAIHVCGQIFLFDPHRAEWVTIGPAGWAAFIGLIGLGLWRAGGVSCLVHAVLALAVPFAILHFVNGSAAASKDARPNLVFVVADTLRADFLRLCGGQVATPVIEQLASRGVVFEKCTSLAPWTPPSMEGMFRSQYPSGLTPGVDGALWLDQLWRYDVPSEEQTLAELLRERGYATGAILANALLPTLRGMNEGHEARAFSHPMLLRPHGLFEHFPFLQEALAVLAPALAPVRPDDTTAALTRYAKSFIRRNADAPFYLWLHYMDPHAPYDPPERHRSGTRVPLVNENHEQDAHATRYGPWPFFHPFPGGERWGIPVAGREFNVAQTDRPYVRMLYEGEIRYLDEQLGKLLDYLDRLGLRDNTYVCFIADHGEEFWEHGDWGHGQSLFEELIHVPWILAGPGIEPKKSDALVSTLSVTPTLAELLGLPRESYWRGTSLAPFLRNDAPAIAAAPVFALGTSNKAFPEPFQMVRDGQYKLIREAGSGEYRLYDLADDPGEQTDVTGDFGDAARALEARLLEWLDTFQHAFPVETSPEDAARRREIEQQLDAMGYLH